MASTVTDVDVDGALRLVAAIARLTIAVGDEHSRRFVSAPERERVEPILVG